MGQLNRDCPHCFTKHSAFTTFGEFIQPGTQIYTVGLYCRGCYGGIVAEIQMAAGQTPCGHNGDIDKNIHLSIQELYPAPIQTKAPEYLSSNIEKFFLQAANSLKDGNFDASAMMSRKTLEVALKKIKPELTGNLYTRIEKLAEDNIITPDIKDWAHIIRDDGNIAAHEEEPICQESAQELLSFSEMFLMYSFTLPGMVKERRHDDTQDIENKSQ